MIVRALDTTTATPYITPGRQYTVIGIDHESYRLLNDISEPILYYKDEFEVIDPEMPDEWVWKRFAADEYYANPPEMAGAGFYERWHDGDPTARAVFREYLARVGIPENG